MRKPTTYIIGDIKQEFRSPSIQRTFWFAEDTHTAEEWDEVQQHVQNCKNEAYFIRENLRNTDAAHFLNRIDDPRFRLYLCHSDRYINGSYWISYGYLCDMQEDRFFVRELTPEEIEQLRTACETEQAKFEKRLRAYLKRYGLSKCSFSTFWANR